MNEENTMNEVRERGGERERGGGGEGDRERGRMT